MAHETVLVSEDVGRDSVGSAEGAGAYEVDGSHGTVFGVTDVQVCGCEDGSSPGMLPVCQLAKLLLAVAVP